MPRKTPTADDLGGIEAVPAKPARRATKPKKKPESWTDRTAKQVIYIDRDLLAAGKQAAADADVSFSRYVVEAVVARIETGE